MIRPLSAILILTVALSGCARLNPGTWLNRGADTPAPTGLAAAPAEDPRPLVAQVTELNVDRTPGGAIIRANALPPTLGWYDAALVAQPVQDGTLTLEFRALPAPEGARPGTPTTRALVAATAVDNTTLAGVQRIVVRGQTNALSSGR